MARVRRGRQGERTGTARATGPRPSGNAAPGLAAGMSTGMLLDYLAVRLNGPRAAAVRLRIGLDVTGDQGGPAEERFRLIVENGILRHTAPDPAENPAGTLRIHHAALADLAYGATTLDDLLAANTAALNGDRTDLDTLLDLLDTFTAGFDVVVPNI
nr:alkyl sulfatase C-terminal domain-containing protein [Streptomyces liangshanensis]